MKEWILSIAVTVLAVSVLSLLLSNGKTSKVIKAVMAFITVLVIIRPILQTDFSSFDVSNIFGSDNIEYQEHYLGFIEENKKESYKKDCLNLLYEWGIKIEEEELNIITDDEIDGKVVVKKIIVNLKNAVIITDKEHIDINGVTNALAERFGLAFEMVEINE